MPSAANPALNPNLVPNVVGGPNENANEPAQSTASRPSGSTKSTTKGTAPNGLRSRCQPVGFGGGVNGFGVNVIVGGSTSAVVAAAGDPATTTAKQNSPNASARRPIWMSLRFRPLRIGPIALPPARLTLSTSSRTVIGAPRGSGARP